MKKGKVTTLVGAQLGSEAKGVVSYYLRDKFQVTVRTGAPNAGHSFVHNGQLFKMQSVPCTWPNKDCLSVIGAGALISPTILKKEVDTIAKMDKGIHERLKIDGAAGILEDRHHHEEGGIDGEIHKRIGSTGEGVGVARRDRMLRDPTKFRLARDCPELKDYILEDTVGLLNDCYHKGMNILLEGCQGSGLSMIHGQWPHVTTSDTNAAQLCADAGLPPQWVSESVLVARTYPIRVAGPSGLLKNELSWDEMSIRVGKQVMERTTVTNKVRRIGEWDEELFKKSVQLNAPHWVALSFIDYLSPEDEGKTNYDDLSPRTHKFVDYLEKMFNINVGMLGTGFDVKKGWTCVNRL